MSLFCEETLGVQARFAPIPFNHHDTIQPAMLLPDTNEPIEILTALHNVHVNHANC